MASTVGLVVDTDVGTDVDDLLALAMLPHLPVAVLAVTTVYGDTDLRARIASVVCRHVGLTTRIVPGRRHPLSGGEVFLTGHEGEGLDGLDEAPYEVGGDAVETLVEVARDHAGQLDVVAIGPLTNVAGAVLRDPAFAGNVRRLHLMGGDYGSPRVEHNFGSDALAAWVVARSGLAVTACGLDVTLRLVLREADLRRVEVGSPAGPLVADQVRRWWRWLHASGRSPHPEGSPPHDPTALLTVLRPELFRVEPAHLAVVGAGPDAGRVEAVAAPDGDPGAARVVRDLDEVAVLAAILGALTPGAA